MGLATLIAGAPSAMIGDIEIDVTMQEQHGKQSTVTESAIETGSNVQDHVSVAGAVITIDGVFSDRPPTLRQKIAQAATGKTAVERWELLDQLQELRTPITLVTSLATYPDMVVVSKTATRRAENGGIIRFTVTLEQLQFAESESLVADEPNDRGPKGKTPASSDAASSSQATGAVSSSGSKPVFGATADALLGN